MTQIEQNAIRAVVQQQLEAFQQNDAAHAFEFASPSIQALFSTPEQFMEMVQTSYAPVYSPRSVIFSDLTVVEGFPTQKVLLMDANGQLFMALYLMQQQPDRSWRIHGCLIAPMDSASDFK